jgi:hypothetical protein
MFLITFLTRQKHQQKIPAIFSETDQEVAELHIQIQCHCCKPDGDDG